MAALVTLAAGSCSDHQRRIIQETDSVRTQVGSYGWPLSSTPSQSIRYWMRPSWSLSSTISRIENHASFLADFDLAGRFLVFDFGLVFTRSGFGLLCGFFRSSCGLSGSTEFIDRVVLEDDLWQHASHD